MLSRDVATSSAQWLMLKLGRALFVQPVAALAPDGTLLWVVQRLGAAAQPRRQARELQEARVHLWQARACVGGIFRLCI